MSLIYAVNQMDDRYHQDGLIFFKILQQNVTMLCGRDKFIPIMAVWALAKDTHGLFS